MAAAPVLAQPYAASAQQTDASEAPSDPPSRAARLSFIDGAVSLQPSGIERVECRAAESAADQRRFTLERQRIPRRGRSRPGARCASASARAWGCSICRTPSIQLRLDAGNLEVTSEHRRHRRRNRCPERRRAAAAAGRIPARRRQRRQHQHCHPQRSGAGAERRWADHDAEHRPAWTVRHRWLLCGDAGARPR